MPESEPQWLCRGKVRGVEVHVAVMADESGVMDMQAQVPAGTPAESASAAFSDLMADAPVFMDATPALRSWIRRWDGSSGMAWATIPSVSASIDSDDMWVTLSVGRVPRFKSPPPTATAP